MPPYGHTRPPIVNGPEIFEKTWRTLYLTLLQDSPGGCLTHIPLVSVNWVIIGSDNGLSPRWCQVIIWTNAGMLLIGPLGTNVSEILITIYTFSFKKLHLKMSYVKWCPLCLGLNLLTICRIIDEQLHLLYTHNYFVDRLWTWWYLKLTNAYKIIYGLPWIMMFLITCEAICQFFSRVMQVLVQLLLDHLMSDQNALFTSTTYYIIY